MTKKMIALCVSIFLFAVCLTSCQSSDAVNTPDESASTTVSTATSASTAATTTEATTAATTTTPPAKPTTTTVKPTTTTMTTVSTTEDWRKYYTSKQILNDNTFQNGFNIACNEANGVTKYCGNWRPTNSKKDSVWQLSQWGTFNSYTDRSGMQCLWEDRLQTANNILANGINRVEYVAERKSLILSMNTYKYFDGHGHEDNSSWPHLLIEQSIISRETYFNLDDEDQLYYSLAADKLILEMDLRLPKFSHEPLPGINACQIVSFYYVVSMRDSGFIWFGVPIFDDRGYDQTPSSDTSSRFMMDFGTGNYMYGVPQVDIYNSTREDGRYDFFSYDNISVVEPNDQWMHVSIDLKPYLMDLASQTMRGTSYNIYTNTTQLKDLYLGGLNLGYEVHGTYDVSFEIANYSLTTYVKK